MELYGEAAENYNVSTCASVSFRGPKRFGHSLPVFKLNDTWCRDSPGLSWFSTTIQKFNISHIARPAVITEWQYLVRAGHS